MASSEEKKKKTVDLAVLVSRYATPFAVVLVTGGLILSRPLSPVLELSIGLIIFGFVFNMYGIRLIQAATGSPKYLIHVRVTVNLTTNVLLIYYLGLHWHPMWLLLALTPIATAIYDKRGRVIYVSATVCMLLIAIHAAHGSISPLEWGEQLAQVAFIFLMTLMINDLSQMAKGSKTFIATVYPYATPLAVILVALGVILSQPISPVREISLGLLAFSVLFNTVGFRLLQAFNGDQSFLIPTRLAANLTVNVMLVYFLGGYWRPMWLLLVLTPFATAIYDTRGKTMFSAVSVSLLLLVIHAARGLGSVLEWGEQTAQILFIILMSLMINELSRMAKSLKAPAGSE
ncbi:MAG: hypothetical protein ABII00_11475 [Elusimicrobiota bacterium]